MLINIDNPHPVIQFLVSVGLGLIIGLQRQWADAPLGGIRTFSLTALLGTVCGLLSREFGVWVVAAGFVGIIATLTVGNLARKGEGDEEAGGDTGMSTEVGLLLTFGVGLMVHIGPVWMAAAVAGGIAVILQAKPELHRLAEKFSAQEIKAIMQFVLITLVILPLVPNETYGPFAVVNPHEVWLMVVLIVGISLTGYIIYKFFGEQAGILLGGILGGIISSTATTVSYARRSREQPYLNSNNAILITIAWSTLYLRVMVEVAIAAPGFNDIWLPVGILLVLSAVIALWMWRHRSIQKAQLPEQGNPSEFKTAFVFAALYSVVVFAVAFAKETYGNAGLMVVAVISGITDVDAITLSTSRLVHAGKLTGDEAWRVIVLAILANVFFKGIIAGVLGGRPLFRSVLFPWCATLVAGGLIIFLL